MATECELIARYVDRPGQCNMCGTPLRGRQRSWCSAKCSRAYARQHKWSFARAAAKRRDGYRCQHCGTGRENPNAHLEVNHKNPRLGQGYGWGCWHHLSNLETLCRRCHRKVTNAQAAARRAASSPK